MNSVIKSRLSRKCILVSITALIISTIIFVFLSETFAMCLSSPGYYGRWEEANSSKLESLQEYISDNGITVASAEETAEWAKENLNFNISVSGNATATFLGNNEAWSVAGIPLLCADGIAYVYAGHSKGTAQIAAFPVAAGSFLLITIPCTYKTIQRIMVLSRKVDSISEGELVLPVESFGSDELTILESGVENLRLSAMSQLDKKSNDIPENSQLVKSLVHDIRTPLTRLTGYLDILRYKKFNDTDEFDKYLNSAARNAGELRLLTDELFAGARTAGSMTSARLAELLFEVGAELTDAGFSVQSVLADDDFIVGMHELNMRRVIDNLSSNIEKYGDIERSVMISSSIDDGMVKIDFTNFINPDNPGEGTGIGLCTVYMLVKESGGKFSKAVSGDVFNVKLSIPLADC